jgi:hypothetical protein
MTRPIRALVATALLGTFALTYAAGASTFGFPDEDSAALMQILVNGVKQLNTLNDQLGTMRKTYSETKKLAGYAEDAVSAFRGLARADLAGSVQLLEDAVPNLRYFDREAHHLNSWTQGRGELTWLVRGCLRARKHEIDAQAAAQQAEENWATDPEIVPYPATTDGAVVSAGVRADQVCGELDHELSGQRLAELILKDFGPPRTRAQLRADQVAADALGDSDALYWRDRTLEEDWKNYEEYCFTAAKNGLAADLDDSIMQRCQAAEVLVQLRSAREMQIRRGEVRQLKDVEAYRLLGENAERKQETDARTGEQQGVVNGSRQMTGPEIRLSAPGYDLRGDE